MILAAALLIAYIIGSVPSAMIVSKLFKLPDPRKQGSGNAGATNVLRVSGRVPALLVLIGDMLKGVLVMLVASRWFGPGNMLLGFCALATVVGHIFPIFFGFKGGKGIATTAGALLILSPWSFIVTFITWASVLGATRFVSLASLIASIAAPIYLLVGGNYQYFIGFIFIAIIIIWKHRDNIARLRSGKEEKITFPI